MKVTVAGFTYDCKKVVQSGTNAIIYLADGRTLKLIDVSADAWNQFVFEGGQLEIAHPIPSNTERLEALEATMLSLMGGNL